MLTNISFKSYSTLLFLTSCVTLHTMDQTSTHKGMILIECKVTEPQCIQYLSNGSIAIGGKSGIQSVSGKDGSSISEKYNQGKYPQQDPFLGPIYQIVSGQNS
jgi:hypothetical protein